MINLSPVISYFYIDYDSSGSSFYIKTEHDDENNKKIYENHTI